MASSSRRDQRRSARPTHGWRGCWPPRRRCSRSASSPRSCCSRTETDRWNRAYRARSARCCAATTVRMMGKLAVVAVLMFGFGYALVPMYKAICDALGINVLSVSERGGAAAASTPSYRPTRRSIAARTVTIEFDANARGPWDFKPAQRSLQVHPGEVATVMYEFRNRAEPHDGRAGHPQLRADEFGRRTSTSSSASASTSTRWPPGESRQWPVVFYVDPKLPKDVTTITLSYTFFEVGGKVPPAPAPSRRRPLPRPRAVARDRGADDATTSRSPRARARCLRTALGRGMVVLRHSPARRLRQGRRASSIPIHVVIAGIVGAALFVLRARAAGALGRQQRRGHLTTATSTYPESKLEEQPNHVRSDTSRDHAVLLRARAVAPSGDDGARLGAGDPGRRPVGQRLRLGQVVGAARLC